MDIREVLELYDRFERREVSLPGYRREEAGRVIRMVNDSGRHCYVAWSDLVESNADAAIQGELEYFDSRGQSFEWKTYSHDRPPDLVARLEKAGFTAGEDEAVMVFDLSGDLAATPALPGLEIRRITDPKALDGYAAVDRQVWAEDPQPFIDELAEGLRDSPDYQSVYVAYLDGKAVCAARVNFPTASPFASLWGGSTLEEYRGRGIYSAVLATRMEEARRRGYSFITIDASPMSRPIVARRGFRLLAMSRPCDHERKMK